MTFWPFILLYTYIPSRYLSFSDFCCEQTYLSIFKMSQMSRGHKLKKVCQIDENMIESLTTLIEIITL